MRSLRCRWRRSAAMLASIVLLPACQGGSSGSGGSPVGGTDRVAPRAVVQFPPEGCLTDANHVALALAVSDQTGIASVRAAGLPAVADADSRWRVSVPLSAGINTIRVETRDTLGNLDASAALVSIRRGTALWIEPSSLALDSSSGDSVVLDPVMRTVFRVRASGVRSVISGPNAGTGVLLASPRDLDVVASLGAAVVTDGELDAVILVDLATGARTVLSSPSIGAGPTPGDLHGIAVDLPRNRALVLDEDRGELMAVDLTTGERSTISSDAVGSGVSLSAARRVAFDPMRNRALVTVEAMRAILAVDLATGNREVLSGGTSGSGPVFSTPFDLAVDLLPDRAYVTDPGVGGIFEVDLGSGARRVLSSHSVGNGPDLITPTSVAVRLDGIPLVLDSSLDALIEVPFGDRRIVSGFSVGEGPALARPVALASSPLFPERLAVAGPTELFTVDGSSGARELISGPGRGAGAPFGLVSALEVSRGPNACIMVLDADLPGLIGVDRLTGQRRTVSGGAFGVGPSFSDPRCMVLEPSVVDCASTALVADKLPGAPAAILRVNLVTGARTILSDPDHGSGPDMLDPIAIEIDLRSIEASAIVLDAELQAIFSVDLFTGNRTLSFFLPPLPGAPTDLALDAGRVLLTIADPPTLVLVSDQATTILSDPGVGSGPSLSQPVALELTPSPTVGAVSPMPVAYVLDAARGSVLALDPRTGARVIRAK